MTMIFWTLVVGTIYVIGMLAMGRFLGMNDTNDDEDWI